LGADVSNSSLDIFMPIIVHNSSKRWGKLAVCLVFTKDGIEGIRANWQFALPPRRDSGYFRAQLPA
jgi:hypothetical protein